MMKNDIPLVLTETISKFELIASYLIFILKKSYYYINLIDGLMALIIYHLVFLLLLPFLLLNLIIKGIKNHLYFKNIHHRFGFGHNNVGNINQNPVLIHAVSLGEVLGIKDFVKRLEISHNLVISVSTATGFQKANELFGSKHRVIYAPWDFVLFINKFLSTVRPQIILLFETEIWPALISVATKQSIPVILLNGRLSKKSFTVYSFFSYLISPIIQSMKHIFVQTQIHKERFCRLGANQKDISVVSSVKFDLQEEAPVNVKEHLKSFLLAASTHPGEEKIIIDIFKNLIQQNIYQGKLVICPRHPERSNGIARLVKSQGLIVSKYSTMTTDDDPEVCVIDEIGLLTSLYPRALCTFMGGSMVPRGGHNLAEPACYGTPIVTGRHNFNFDGMVNSFLDSNACLIANSNLELFTSINRILNDPELSSSLVKNAKQVLIDNRGSTEKQASYIIKSLNQ